jgi:hypothetical protein
MNDQPEPALFAADVDPPTAPETGWVAWILGLLVVGVALSIWWAMWFIVGLSLR